MKRATLKVPVVISVGVICFVGAWALWGYHFDGYAPVVVRAKVVDASTGQPIPDAILITLHSEDLLEDREKVEGRIARALKNGPGSLDYEFFYLKQDFHAARVDAEGRVEVVAYTLTSGIGMVEWNITKRFSRSFPALALVRAPGYAEARIEPRPFLEGPVGEPEHMVADLGTVSLTRDPAR